MLVGEGAAPAALELAREGGGRLGAFENMVGEQAPRFVLGRVGRLAGVVRLQPRSDVITEPGVELVRMLNALQDIDIAHGRPSPLPDLRLACQPKRVALLR